MSDRQQQRSRGQVIIVGAIIIAFSLIGLMVVMNSVMMTQQLDSTGVSGSTGGSLTEMKDTVQKGYSGLVIGVNDDDVRGNEEDVIENNANELTNTLYQQRARTHGASLTVDVVDVIDGTMVRQLDERAFTDKDGDSDWQIVEVTDLRRTRFEVDQEDLGPRIDSEDIDDASTLRQNAFHVVLKDLSEKRVYMFRDDAGNAVVATQEDNKNVEVAYREPVESIEVGLFTGTVNGEHVFDLESNLISQLELHIRNGGAATGTYTLAFNQEEEPSRVVAGNTYDISENQDPFRVDSVWAVKLDVQYKSPDITYTDDVILRPCNPRDEYCHPLGGIPNGDDE